MTPPIQTIGIHHVTLNGADRKTSIQFWRDVLGMKLIFEQPNLDDVSVNHLYFNCGNGQTITIFTNEDRKSNKSKKLKNITGSVHHIALWVRPEMIELAQTRLNECSYAHTGVKDRGFMDSLYFRDPLGLLIELSSYKFEPPPGVSYEDILEKAYEIRVNRGAKNIEERDVLDAVAKFK